MKRKTQRKSRRRKIYRGGLFGAAEYVGSIAGNTIEQQMSNIGNSGSLWGSSHNQGISGLYQGGRRRRTFRRKHRNSRRR
jgi:hypothetical protein